MILRSLFLLALPVLLFLLFDELALLTEPDDDAPAASFVPSIRSTPAIADITPRGPLLLLLGAAATDATISGCRTSSSPLLSPSPSTSDVPSSICTLQSTSIVGEVATMSTEGCCSSIALSNSVCAECNKELTPSS